MLDKSHKSDNVITVFWSFRDYREGGQNPIENWYAGDLLDGGRFGFDALLKNTAKTENHLEWSGFKLLKGDAKKERIWQLDFIADGRQYRVLGKFGEVRKQAILLVGCYHKGSIYTPVGAIQTAIRRAKKLREKKADTIERKIKFDL